MSLFSRKRFKLRNGTKSDIPEGLWMKCDSCHQTVYRADVEENLHVCTVCGKHYRIGAWKRVEITVDADSFTETHGELLTSDPLGFSVGGESYLERIARARESSHLEEALLTGFAALNGQPIVLGVMETDFIMGSMGAVVGEKFCRMIDDSIEKSCALVVFAASGGARMQEGILALMQMAKTADAVKRLNDARLPYISVLTDPTTGGVLASFASLGDIIVAEPGAYIGFAGKRLIMGALKMKLPEGFQTAEYQFQNGFVDAIVKRQDMRNFLSRCVQYLTPQIAQAGGQYGNK
ncbi:MAG TPA: acetyl-CoA carboxylase carboxyltransferase subunit beta [Candidatus Hydrogenedentes bacterium]|nr:acetyl-CoA carboxylase carboxyltransferase subunit beta [Candidatus Hydrogenedentota bacterium]